MRKTMMTAVVGIVLMSTGLSWAQESPTSSPQQARVELKLESSSQAQESPAERASKSKLESQNRKRVKGVVYQPRGRGRYDKAPEAKPLIYVDGFETYGGR